MNNDTSCRSSKTGVSMIATATTKILTMIHQRWKTRCDMKYHSSDHQPYRDTILLPKVQEIYNNHSQSLNQIDRSHFDIPIATIQTYNTTRLQHWIR